MSRQHPSKPRARRNLLRGGMRSSRGSFRNNESRQWVTDTDLEDFVTDGLRIARKQSPPNLMLMPIQAPQEAN